MRDLHDNYLISKMNHNAIYDPESFEFFMKKQIHQDKKADNLSLLNSTFLNNTGMSNTNLMTKDDYNIKSAAIIQDKPL